MADPPLPASYQRLLDEAERPRRDLPPLVRAAADGDIATIERLLAEGHAVDSPTLHEPGSMFFHGGRTPLMLASHRGHFAAVRVLLDAGANIAAVDDAGETPMSHAATGQLAVVELLLARGAPLTPPGAKFTPLYHAARRGDVAMIACLLDHGAAIDERIWTGATPVSAAAAAGAAPAVALLIQRGAGVNMRDDHGRTPLVVTLASDFGELEAFMRHDPVVLGRMCDVTRLLLQAGADPRLRDRDGDGALDVAARRTVDLLDVVRLLVSAGAEANAKDATGRTPLHRASEMNSVLVAAYLLEQGADPNVPDDAGATAIVHATRNGYATLTGLFVEPQGPGGLTPPAASGACIKTAGAQFVSGDYAAALDTYRWLPAPLRERIPAIASNLGYCFQQLGDHVEAIRHFELAFERDPKVNVARGICFSLSQQKAWTDMLRFAQVVVDANPQESYAWQQLAIAHAGMNQHRAAVTAGRRALELEPRNAYAMCNLALAEKEVGDAVWVETLTRAIELEPSLGTDDEIKSALAQATKQAKPPTQPKPSKAKPARAKQPKKRR